MLTKPTEKQKRQIKKVIEDREKMKDFAESLSSPDAYKMPVEETEGEPFGIEVLFEDINKKYNQELDNLYLKFDVENLEKIIEDGLRKNEKFREDYESDESFKRFINDDMISSDKPFLYGQYIFEILLPEYVNKLINDIDRKEKELDKLFEFSKTQFDNQYEPCMLTSDKYGLTQGITPSNRPKKTFKKGFAKVSDVLPIIQAELKPFFLLPGIKDNKEKIESLNEKIECLISDYKDENGIKRVVDYENIAEITRIPQANQITFTSTERKITDFNAKRTAIKTDFKEDGKRAQIVLHNEFGEDITDKRITFYDRFLLDRCNTLWIEGITQNPDAKYIDVLASDFEFGNDRHQENYESILNELNKFRTSTISKEVLINGEPISYKERDTYISFKDITVLVNGQITTFGIRIKSKPYLLELAEEKKTLTCVPSDLFLIPGMRSTAEGTLRKVYYIIDNLYRKNNANKLSINKYLTDNKITTHKDRERKDFIKVLEYYKSIGIIKELEIKNNEIAMIKTETPDKLPHNNQELKELKSGNTSKNSGQIEDKSST